MPQYSRFYPTSDELPLPTACYVHMPSGPALDRWPPEELARIRTILRRLTSVRVDNPEDAEDLVQETFLTMAAKCPPGELEKGLLVWGMAVLRKKVGNYYRRAQRRSAVEIDVLETEGSRWARESPSAEASLHVVELRALVGAIVSRFSPAERAVMDLVLSGMPTSEIARKLQPESYQSIANRAHRGRRKLFRELARYGYTAAGRGAARGRPKALGSSEDPASISMKEVEQS